MSAPSEKQDPTPASPSDPSKPTSSGAESPRTAREPDFDDETHHDEQPSALAPQGERGASPQRKRVSFQEDTTTVPPPKPPRPMSPQAQAEATLIEAFPSIDIKVVKAVLLASGGKVEPAFNALLSMSDPNYVEELPPPPPRQTRQAQPPRTQMEQDELYARQLAEHYNSAGRGYAGYGSRGRGDPHLPQRRRETGLKPNELEDDREHSFFDDDLPVIRQNIQKGFQETRTTINKWVSEFKKRLDGDDSDEELAGHPSGSQYQRQDYGPSQSAQLAGIRRSAERARRSGDQLRYDADPHVIGDDFRHLDLRDNEEEAPPRPPRRPLANPDLYKPAMRQGTDKSDDSLYRRPSPGPERQTSPAAGGGLATTKQAGNKWQPLTSVEPRPEADDHDPFSLADSDDEPSPESKKSVKFSDTQTSGKDGAVGAVASVKEDGTAVTPEGNASAKKETS